MTDDGRCENEINSRIAKKQKEAFGDRKELLTKSLEKSTKVKQLKQQYGQNHFMAQKLGRLRKKISGILEALELWLWRRMEKISQKDIISNEVVLGKVVIERELITMLRS